MTSFLIGATASNCGKSTLTMGLLRALAQRGLTVQAFKCGPDYIDPMFHRMASHRESHNLDSFMSSPSHVRQLFAQKSEGADVRVVEGVMGLYDGFDKARGSSAEIATMLDIPVVLVVNAQSTAYSVAPLIHGFASFPGAPRIGGVVFNKVSSERHYDFLLAACADAGVPCLGYLPTNPRLVIPSRHLGLTIKEQEEAEALIALAATEAETHIDIDKLLTL